jgi:hypothetical protein
MSCPGPGHRPDEERQLGAPRGQRRARALLEAPRTEDEAAQHHRAVGIGAPEEGRAHVSDALEGHAVAVDLPDVVPGDLEVQVPADLLIAGEDRGDLEGSVVARAVQCPSVVQKVLALSLICSLVERPDVAAPVIAEGRADRLLVLALLVPDGGEVELR